MNESEKIPRDDSPAGTTRLQQDVSREAGEAGAALKEHAADLRRTAEDTMRDARDAVTEQSERAKETAADEMSRTARGLHAAADELEGSPLQQDLLREAADGLKHLSESLEGKSIGAMAREFSDFGRRNPAAFLGGAALAGFALARFARASAAAGDERDERGAPYPGARPARSGAYAASAAAGASGTIGTEAPASAGTTGDTDNG